MERKQLQRKLYMLRLTFTSGGWKKAEYIRRKKIFHSIGEHCYYHPSILPAEPHLINFGNNVFVGTGVHFITHNMANCVFNNMSFRGGYYSLFLEL